MFTIDQKITEKQLRDKNILKVFVSMNNHPVATPDTSLEEARSYVFLFREGKKKISAYIGLHLLLTDRKLFYAYSENPFSEGELDEVENEARNFAEDLGAMLDEIDFKDTSEPELKRWIEEQSIFSEKKQPESAPEEQAPRPEVVAVAPLAQAPEAPKQPAPEVHATIAPEPAAPKQPAPEVHATVAPEPAVSKQATPEIQVTIEPEFEVVSARPASQPHPVETPEMPDEALEPAPVQKSDQAKSEQIAAARRRQEITRKTSPDGIATSQKQAAKKEPLSATGVVSRDREALARLLTSF